MSHREHRRWAPRSVRVAILTISDTRTPASDHSGRLIHRRLARHGHPVVDYRIVPDDPRGIARVVRGWMRNRRVEAMILNGGTGISPRDATFEAVERLLSKKLEGFGEIYRWLSYRQVGSAAFLSRAVAGLCGDKVLFSLPGSEPAVRLALDRLILPELGHLLQQIRKNE